MRTVHVMLLAALAGVSLSAPAVAEDAAKVVGTTGDEGVGDQRIICRKHVEVGSLVRKKKQCFTKAEWDRIAAAEQVGVKKLQDQLSTRSLSN